MTPPTLWAGSVLRRGWGRWGVAAAAIFDSAVAVAAVAVAAVGPRVWGVALPSPSPGSVAAAPPTGGWRDGSGIYGHGGDCC